MRRSSHRGGQRQWQTFPHLHLIAMFPHHLHQPGDNVRDGMVVDGLFEGSEDLE